MKNKELESEANLFAILLLMPSEFIKKDFEAGISLVDENWLKDLAKKYEVPVNAVVMRYSYYLKHKY